MISIKQTKNTKNDNMFSYYRNLRLVNFKIKFDQILVVRFNNFYSNEDDAGVKYYECQIK